MNNGDQLKKANETHLHHTALMLACQDLESATYAARKAREDLRRATRNRLQAKERHDDAHHLWLLKSDTPEDALMYVRVEFAAWALQDSKRNVEEKLQDYRDALKRVEVLGAAAGEADSHEVPAYLRHRARKAIALADAFGNKVAMDATLHEGLERPRLPELSPEVEVTEFAVIDPLEPVEAWTPPEPRAKLVPLEDYEAETDVSGSLEDYQEPKEKLDRAWLEANGAGPEDEDPDDDGGAAIPAGERLETEAERFAFWREVNGAALEDEEKALEAAREPEHMSPEWWKRVTFSAPLNTKDPLPATREDDEDEK